MKKCTELLKNGVRSLVEVRETDTDRVEKYVVCSNFDNSKAYGSKWDYGHYFDVLYGDMTEEQMKAATMYLYDIKQQPITYDRLSEIAMFLKDGLMEDDEESAIEYMKETCELTETEAEYFGVKEKLFPKSYDVYEVTMERTQKATICVAIPHGKNPYNLDDYIENSEYIDPDIGDEGDWEVEFFDILNREGLSIEEFNSMYNEETVWNADDVTEGRI